MELEEIRRRLGGALQDPGRRQLAHIVVLDIAMTITETLQGKGLSATDIARATEEISAYLTGESAELPPDLPSRQSVLDALMETIQRMVVDPTFARVFG